MTQPVPVIDIAPFLNGRPGGAATVARIREAAEDTGFFLVTGHGVDAGATRALYDSARAFFDLPDKALLPGPAEPGGLTFLPLGAEALAATTGSAGDTPPPADLKQSLNYGPRLPGAPWPAAPAALRPAFLAYFAEMERLAHGLRRIFCAAIGLAEDYFEPAFEGHLSALRVIDYPAQAQAPRPGQLRAGAHTDYGFLTILRSEAAPGGLQVQTREGVWVDVPAIDGAYVVNIADAFMRWTNDRWKSTPHRVVNPPAEAGAAARRQSIPFFVNPSARTRIACLDAFRGDGERYGPVTYADWIALKTRQAVGRGGGARGRG